MIDPLNPIVGQFVFDGTEFVSYAVDLAPGACQGMLPTREGYEEACKEIIANHSVWGAKAGIPDQDVTDLGEINQRIARIDIYLPPLAKAFEMLTETRYMLDDKRQRIVLDAAQSVDRRAKKLPELMAKYQKTRVYRSVLAKKALKTKEQNAGQAVADAEAQAPQLPVVVPPVVAVPAAVQPA